MVKRHQLSIYFEHDALYVDTRETLDSLDDATAVFEELLGSDCLLYPVCNVVGALEDVYDTSGLIGGGLYGGDPIMVGDTGDRAFSFLDVDFMYAHTWVDGRAYLLVTLHRTGYTAAYALPDVKSSPVYDVQELHIPVIDCDGYPISGYLAYSAHRLLRPVLFTYGCDDAVFSEFDLHGVVRLDVEIR